MARITHQQLKNNILNNVQRNLRSMDKFQDQLSSGKQIRRPSDEPTKVARILTYKSAIAENKQYHRNMNESISWANTTEEALYHVTEVLQRTRELSVRGATGSHSVQSHKAIADEIEELSEIFVQLGNSSYESRYIFSGHKTTTRPFEKQEINEGDNIEFDLKIDGERLESLNVIIGDDTGIEVEVGDKTYQVTVEIDDEGRVNAHVDGIESKQITRGVRVDEGKLAVVKYRGENIFNLKETKENINWEMSQGVDITGNIDGKALFADSKIFHTMFEAVGALRDGRNEDVSGILGDLDRSIDSILDKRSSFGAMLNGLELSRDKNESEKVNMTELLSRIEDIDIAETLMNYKVQEYVYHASLQTGASIMQPTLMDFLR